MGKLVNNSAAREINVACLGMLVLDVFGKPIDRFPAKGTSEYFDTLEIHPGGCTYNTGVDAGWLGVRVRVLGMLGADSLRRSHCAGPRTGGREYGGGLSVV